MSSTILSPAQAIATALSSARSRRSRKDIALIQERMPSTKDPSMEFLRIQAIRLDVGRSAHLLLDDVGVPFLSEKDAGRLSAFSIDAVNLNAFEEIHRERPYLMRQWLSEAPAIGALKIACALAISNLTQKRLALAALATMMGADWALQRPGIAKNFPDGLAQYDQAVASAIAISMKSTTPATAPAPSIPRF